MLHSKGVGGQPPRIQIQRPDFSKVSKSATNLDVAFQGGSHEVTSPKNTNTETWNPLDSRGKFPGLPGKCTTRTGARGTLPVAVAREIIPLCFEIEYSVERLERFPNTKCQCGLLSNR